jgi:hypothetical protein
MKRLCFILFIFVILLQPVLAESIETTVILKMQDHPRLWVGKEDLQALRGKIESPKLQLAAEKVIKDANWILQQELIQENEESSYQAKTRAIASRLKNLTLAWVITGKMEYRKAAMLNLKNMMQWNQISCEARKGMPHDPLWYFCLSAGEHCADVALMYDLFKPDLNEEEKKIFNDVIDRFYLKAALRAKDRNPWWAHKEWSNWNAVCSGGIGMLALAFYDERPEARELIPFVEESLSQYFKSYIKNGGGNHEGTGYWNYGMHYAMRYLLSWERATGKKHPAFSIPEIGKSLHFPLDFTKINFGDNDGWHPSGFFFMMAERTKQNNAALRAAHHVYGSLNKPSVKTNNLTEPKKKQKPKKPRTKFSRVYAPDWLYAIKYIPSETVMKDMEIERQNKKQPLARVYNGLGWGALADDSVFPNIRLAVRGGSNKVTGHGHIDVMSFKCRIGNQTIIEDQKGGGYSPVTFTQRGHHVYSRSPAAKSSLFVHGLPPMEDGEAKSIVAVSGNNLQGIRLDGTGLYLKRWRRDFIGRLFLMVDQSYFLIIDASQAGGSRKNLEARFHTYGKPEIHKDWVTIRKGDETLTASFASLGKTKLIHAFGMPETGQNATKMLRWLGSSSVLATALNPGNEKLELKLQKISQGYSIKISGNNIKDRLITVTDKLHVIGSY